MTREQGAYDELCCYTLAHRGPEFVHQHVVDAFAAQHAGPATKPIQIAFALVGLYLHLERGFTGRAVQDAHRRLAGRTRSWPSFALPTSRGSLTVVDVLAGPAGPERDRMIDDWCASVWDAYRSAAPAVKSLLEAHGLI